jgi:hypothetical protein
MHRKEEWEGKHSALVGVFETNVAYNDVKERLDSTLKNTVDFFLSPAPEPAPSNGAFYRVRVAVSTLKHHSNDDRRLAAEQVKAALPAESIPGVWLS